jgi:hypothetical protein
MSELTGTHKRLKMLTHQVITKESDCRIEESDNGELVVYTGIVRVGSRYRLARPEEQMDFIPENNVIL